MEFIQYALAFLIAAFALVFVIPAGIVFWLEAFERIKDHCK